MWPFSSSKSDEESSSSSSSKPPPASASTAEDMASTVFKDDPLEEDIKPEKGSMPGFDPSGLERAAKAAKELNDFKYAREAFDIARAKEKRREEQAKADVEKFKTQQQAMVIEQTRVQENERRKTLNQDHNLKKEQAYMNDQLSRKRHQDNLNAQRAMREQQMKQEEQFQLKLEAMKRQTAEYDAKLKKDVERTRVEAEAVAKTVQERKNWDLHMQRSKMEAQELRVTVLESVKEAGTMMGQGINEFLQDRQKLGTTVGLFTLLAVGLYGAKVSTGVLGRFVEARLGKPPLVRETSRHSPFTSPLQAVRRMFAPKTSALEGMVVEPKLTERLSTLATSTMNTKKNGAPFRHALLYGPPGTGKTMFARQLAQSSGLDYAILTGGDVAPLGRDGVTEIHKLFDWAGTSRKGLLVFVDEADAFLRKRTGKAELSEDLRNALNAFLYRTGTESKNFMVVYATNEPTMLDTAITDRTDELVRFDLPGDQERREMLKLYFDKYVVHGHENAGRRFLGSTEQIKVEGIDDSVFDELTTKTKGFSGREIAKLAIAWQATAYANPNCILDKRTFNLAVDNAIEQHLQKDKWANI